MLEIDKDGNEWFGYTFSTEDSDPAAVTETFLGNVQYAEWLFRRLCPKKGRRTLEVQLNQLFAFLPQGVQDVITNDRPSLVREIVRTRGRFAHGGFEQTRPVTSRVHTLSIKVAALLSFVERTRESEPDGVVELAKGGSPYLRRVLAEPDDPQHEKRNVLRPRKQILLEMKRPDDC